MNIILILIIVILNICSAKKSKNNITTSSPSLKPTTPITTSSLPTYEPTYEPTSKPSKKSKVTSSTSSTSSPSKKSKVSTTSYEPTSKPSKKSKVTSTSSPSYTPTSSPSYIPTELPSYIPTESPSIENNITTIFENVYYPNNTLCSAFGINDLTPYKYNLPITSGDVNNNDLQLFVPVYSSTNLNERDSSIKHAIIAIHGYLRNADEMLCLGKQTANERTDTIIVAPYFSSEQISTLEWGSNLQGVTSDYLSAYWDSSSWMSGGDNTFDSRTSYDALDNIVDTLGNSDNFPGLEIISVIGYSAGAQMVNRYAWATDIDRNATSIYDGWKMRYIVSDASSYLYLDENRPIAKCIPLSDNGDDVSCDAFAVPSTESIEDCDNYDEWKYGISSFPTSGYSYFSNFIPGSSSVNDRTELFLQKDIRYVFGKQDSCNCNQDDYVNKDYCYVSGDYCSPNAYGGTNCCDTYPDSYSNDLSTTCGSTLQGYNRLQRGLVYMSYLEWYSEVKPTYSTMDMMHNCTAFFLSDELKELVFDVEGLTFNDFIVAASLEKDLLSVDSTAVSKHRPVMHVSSQYTLIILGIFILVILIGNVVINNILSISTTDTTSRLGTRLTKRDDGIFE